MKSSFAAQRKHLRVAWRIPVAIRLVRKKTVLKAMTCNVSSHGVMVFTKTPLEPATDVVVSIVFPGGGTKAPMNIKGKVVRQDPVIAGTQAIAFHDLQANQVHRIRTNVFECALQLMERISEFPAFWDLTDLDLLALASVCHEMILMGGGRFADSDDHDGQGAADAGGDISLSASVSTVGTATAGLEPGVIAP